jgi:phosphoenolpyruvate carboxykinase (ATP)
MVRAAIGGELRGVPTVTDPVFGVEIPTAVPGVPSDVLLPRNTWADPAAYDEAAATIARMFHDNFDAYADGVSAAVRDAGPRLVRGARAANVSEPGEG